MGDITKLFVGYRGCRVITNGFTNIRLASVNFYDTDGKIIKWEHNNILGCWLYLNGHFHFVNRRALNFARNEVFYIKKKGQEECDVYIPCEAVGLKNVGKDTSGMGDYIYTYDVYQFNGSDLLKFTDNEGNTEQIDDSTIRIRVFNKYELSDEAQKERKLFDEIEKTCGIMLDTWKMKEILKHYKIVKRRK